MENTSHSVLDLLCQTKFVSYLFRAVCFSGGSIGHGRICLSARSSSLCPEISTKSFLIISWTASTSLLNETFICGRLSVASVHLLRISSQPNAFYRFVQFINDSYMPIPDVHFILLKVAVYMEPSSTCFGPRCLPCYHPQTCCRQMYAPRFLKLGTLSSLCTMATNTMSPGITPL